MSGEKRANTKTLLSAAERSIGSQEVPDVARIEIQNLLADCEVFSGRLVDLMSRISYHGRKRLRYVFYEMALSVVGKNGGFRELHRNYTERTKNPLKKMQSLIAVSCKLIRVLYALLTKGVTYDGTKMLGDIHRPEAYTQAV